MASLRYTLLADGSSDAALMPILTWSLIENGIQSAIHAEWADLRRLKTAISLEDRVRRAIKYYPCDVLFVHRDAEKEPIEKRVTEIHDALKATEIDVPLNILSQGWRSLTPSR